jgi:hypothetical protein
MRVKEKSLLWMATSPRISGKGVEKCQLCTNKQYGLVRFWRVGTSEGGKKSANYLCPNKWREGFRKVPTMSEQGFGESGLAKGGRKVPTMSKQVAGRV